MRVLFLPYHGIGHFNPCFNLAETLKTQGHEIFFSGASFFKSYVNAQRYPYHPLNSVPFGLNFEPWFIETESKKNRYWRELRARHSDRLYNLRRKELSFVIETCKPEVILIDAMQATDIIVIYDLVVQYQCHVGIIHNMLPTYFFEGRPPVNSEVSPEDKQGFLEARKKVERKKIKRTIKQKIKFFGMDDFSIIKRRIKKNNFPNRYISNDQSLTNFTTQNIDEFILVPREFDFPTFREKEYQHFIGYTIYHTRNDTVDPRYNLHRDSILALKSASKKKLVYCSFGTVDAANKKIILSFLQRLIQAIGEEYILIIATKLSDDEINSLNLNPHIFLFSSVPQLELLNHTDVFISHGGLSSIKESIDAEVPLLMFPVHDDYDPRGNTARVVYHKLGLKGDAITDTSGVIKTKINELLVNPVYKANLKHLKEVNTKKRDLFLHYFNLLKPLR